MGTRRRLSSESSSYSCSSGLSYYGFGSSVISDEEVSSANQCAARHNSDISRTFFDDVKVILSRHDSKLSKLEDDLSCVVRWLNDKFDFVLKYESTSSIPTEDHVNNSDDGLVDGPDQDAGTSVSSRPESSQTPIENVNNEDQDMQVFTDQSENNEDFDEISQSNFGDDNDSVKDVSLSDNSSKWQIRLTSSKSCTPATSSHINVKQPKPSKQLRSRDPKELQRPSQCDICGKFLKDPSCLRQHKKIHLNIRPFVCNEQDCGKSFRRKFHLQTHALIHKGVKDHQCGYCGRCFLLQKDLITHERIHTGERPFNCPECPKSFTLKSHLVMHLRTHTGEKPYKCDVCNKTFSQSNSLRLHKKKIHQGTNNDPSTGNQHFTKKSGTRKKKAGKVKEAKNAASTAAPVASPPPTPAKLPIYRNQSTLLTSFQNAPSTSRVVPTVTFLQQPILANQSFELLEPIDTTNINSVDKIILTESTLNMLSALPSGNMNAVGNSMPLITSEILNIPQHLLFPRNNSL